MQIVSDKMCQHTYTHTYTHALTFSFNVNKIKNILYTRILWLLKISTNLRPTPSLFLSVYSVRN